MISIKKAVFKLFFRKDGEKPYSIVYYKSRKFIPLKIVYVQKNERICLCEISFKWFPINKKSKRIGWLFHENGKVSSKGILQQCGLYKGKSYWENGKIKFKGICNDKGINGAYYGPSYPLHGTFFDENGEKLYSGEFQISRSGSLAYPHVDIPQNFGSITW